MKKRLSLLLLVVMAMCLLTACPKKDPNDGDKTTGLNRDIIYKVGANCMSHIKPTAAEDAWSDMILARLKQVEDDLVIKFDFQDEGTNLASSLNAEFASGAVNADLVFSGGSELVPMYSTGMFANIKDIEAINLEDEEVYGTPALLKFAEYGNGLYGLYSTGSIAWPKVADLALFNAVFVNDALVTNFNLEHPIELYEKQLWDFNRFKSFVQSASSMDSSSPTYGLDVWIGDITLPRAALYGNGCPIVDTSSGRATFGYASSAANAALEWARDMYNMDAVNIDDEDGRFALGKATLYLGHTHYFFVKDEKSMQQNIRDISFVPFPTGPNIAQVGSINTGYFDTPLSTSIVKNGDEQETGMVIAALAAPLGNQEYLDYTKDFYFPDYNNSFEYYNTTAKGASYLYNSQLSSVIVDVENALVSIVKGEQAVSQAINSVEARATNAIDAQFNR